MVELLPANPWPTDLDPRRRTATITEPRKGLATILPDRHRSRRRWGHQVPAPHATPAQLAAAG